MLMEQRMNIVIRDYRVITKILRIKCNHVVFGSGGACCGAVDGIGQNDDCLFRTGYRMDII